MNANLFQAASLTAPGPTNPTITRGSLVNFQYAFHKPGHDPSPMVLVTDVWPAYIRGVNLNYLTFPTIKKLIWPQPRVSMCDNPGFSYQYIKGNEYIVSAFRQYKRQGVKGIRKFNCEFIVKVLELVRSFDPNEVEAIRKSVREQINRLTNPAAAPSEEMPMGQNPVPPSPIATNTP